MAHVATRQPGGCLGSGRANDADWPLPNLQADSRLLDELHRHFGPTTTAASNAVSNAASAQHAAPSIRASLASSFAAAAASPSAAARRVRSSPGSRTRTKAVASSGHPSYVKPRLGAPQRRAAYQPPLVPLLSCAFVRPLLAATSRPLSIATK